MPDLMAYARSRATWRPMGVFGCNVAWKETNVKAISGRVFAKTSFRGKRKFQLKYSSLEYEVMANLMILL